MQVEDTYREFWEYLTQDQKDLMMEGQYLMNNIIKTNSYHFKDYSFLIFPYAKAYEGFLKKLCMDVGMISRVDYISDHFRLGKMMSPNLVEKLGNDSLYKKVCERANRDLADKIWQTWKIGRNQVFHYFPHNLKSVTFQEAEQIINTIVQTMEEAFKELRKNAEYRR